MEIKETIAAAALQIGELTISAPPPARHHTLIHRWVREIGERPIRAHMQGFLTSTGRYVGREEALVIAKEAGQVTETTHRTDELFSEDLW